MKITAKYKISTYYGFAHSDSTNLLLTIKYYVNGKRLGKIETGLLGAYNRTYVRSSNETENLSNIEFITKCYKEDGIEPVIKRLVSMSISESAKEIREMGEFEEFQKMFVTKNWNEIKFEIEVE